MVATKKEWLASLREEPAKHDRSLLLNRILLALLLGFFLAAAIHNAYADPIFRAESQGIVITIYDEPCTHQEHVTNLPKRATWSENGKVYDGCVGVQPQAGVAMFWWDDKTVAVVPVSAFVKVVGA